MQIIENDTVVIVSVIEDQCSGLWKALEPYVGLGKKSIVLDFSQVNFLNSVNIAAIISCRNKVVAGGGRIAVAEIKDRVKSVFRVLKLERLFDLNLDKNSAVKLVQSAPV
jgi:anti-anti-sigma factor